MSRIQEVKVTCPKCNEEGDFAYYHSITLGRNHKSINDFEHGAYGMNLEILSYRCESCGKDTTAVHDLLINDLENDRMIQLSVDGNDEAINESKKEYHRRFGEQSEFIIVHSPLEIPPLFEKKQTMTEGNSAPEDPDSKLMEDFEYFVASQVGHYYKKGFRWKAKLRWQLAKVWQSRVTNIGVPGQVKEQLGEQDAQRLYEDLVDKIMNDPELLEAAVREARESNPFA